MHVLTTGRPMGIWDDIRWNISSTKHVQKAILKKRFLTIGKFWQTGLGRHFTQTAKISLMHSVSWRYNFCHLTKYLCYLNKSLVMIFLFNSLGWVKTLTWSPLFSPITRLCEPVYQVLCFTNDAICWMFCSFSYYLFSRLMEFWSPGKRKPFPHPLKNIYIYLCETFISCDHIFIWCNQPIPVWFRFDTKVVILSMTYTLSLGTPWKPISLKWPVLILLIRLCSTPTVHGPQDWT